MINIAIDGYSSCGKSTMAKALAKELSYIYIDTGAMYRSIALFALRENLFELGLEKLIERLPEISVTFGLNPNTEKIEVQLNGEWVEQHIRTMEVSGKVSEIAAIPHVRKKLVELQQRMGEDKGVVMDGRDIGTVVFPNAELKVFMTASPEIRAQRRFDELQAKGDKVSLEDVKENLKHRDYVDTHREADPLRQAEDAVVIDNSNLTPLDQLTKAIQLAKERGA